MWFDLSWCFGSPLVCCLRVVLDLFVYCVGVFVVLLLVSVLGCAGSVWLCVFDLVCWLIMLVVISCVYWWVLG